MSESVSNSFSAGYRPGGGPQHDYDEGAGYLGIGKILAEAKARKIAEKEARKIRRQRRLKAKRARRYYAEKKARMAGTGPGRHPSLTVAESAAVEEAAGLA